MIGLLFTLCLFGAVKTSDIVDLQVQTVRRGDDVTVKCDQKTDKDDLVWYQQSLGKLPQYISCIYKLPKRNLSLSDAGTHYCAVAECKHEAESTEGENNSWIDVALVTSNVISVIVIMVLGGLLCKKQQKGSVSGQQENSKHEVEDADALNYATVKFAQKPPSRAPRVKESQDIYSQLKVRYSDCYVRSNKKVQSVITKETQKMRLRIQMS
ncbi:hypothetical protein MHYP_G00007850 [Metynnis hypsauchen]